MIQPLRLEIPNQIATDRLLLRGPQQGDGMVIFPAIQQSFAELKLWMPWATNEYAVADAEDWCLRAAARFLTRDEAAYLIFNRDDSSHIGTVSVFTKGWDIPKFEIGYWLASRATGHCFMTEAVNAVTEMTFISLQARRIEIRTDMRNTRSRRVAERVGYQLEGILKNNCRDNAGELNDDCVYAATR
jgi:RimJ/RimL family protein N-acetyltransferase